MHNIEHIMLHLTDCLCTKIAEEAALGKVENVCICTVVAGDSVPLDYCGPGACDSDGCGIAWIRLVSVGVPADMSIDTGVARRNCGMPVQAIIEAGIGRCSRTDTSDISEGQLPSADDHLAEVLQQLEDLAILRWIAECCHKGTYIEEYAPFGPEGGCVGGIVTFRVDVP